MFDLNRLNEQIESALKLQQDLMKQMSSFSFGDISHLSQLEQEQALTIQGDIKKLAKTKFETPEQIMEAINKLKSKHT